MKIQDLDRISGDRLFNIFDSLLKNRIILKLHILGQDIEGFSIVTGVDKSNRKPVFLIDYPGKEKDLFKDSVGKKIFLEYTGIDKIQYSFKTFISAVDEENIRLYFPEAIERIQRRKHFRVAPPLGTTLYFKVRNKRYEWNVVDLSESGALATDSPWNYNEAFFFKGGELFNLQIICEGKRTKSRVLVSKARIIRLEKQTSTGRFRYALKFLEIENKEQEMLKTFIFNCQREELRKRSPFS